MFRRIASIVALLGFFANQLAAMPHSHAEMSAEQQREHDTHRHVHIGMQHGHAHKHDHVHAEASQHDDHQQDRSPANLPGNHHDADAIYLPACCVVVLSDGCVTVSAKTVPTAINQVLPAGRYVSDCSGGRLLWRWADDGSAACPRYLQLRTLRI